MLVDSKAVMIPTARAANIGQRDFTFPLVSAISLSADLGSSSNTFVTANLLENPENELLRLVRRLTGDYPG